MIKIRPVFTLGQAFQLGVRGAKRIKPLIKNTQEAFNQGRDSKAPLNVPFEWTAKDGLTIINKDKE